MRSIFISLIFFTLIGLGFASPLVFVLGYVWVDIFTPQRLAYSILPLIPVSLVLGLLVVISFFLLKRNQHIKLRPQTLLTVVLALWMTISLSWAVVPDAAWGKWDWAFKSLVFSCFVPSFLRSRVHIEAFLWTVVLSGMGHCITFAPKVLLSGGGYGMALGLVGGNVGYGEGSTLAMFAVCLIPVCLYLYRYQTLIPYPKATRWMLMGFIAAAVITALGTFARTGLVCLVTLGLLLLLKLENKAKILLVLFAVGGLVLALVGDDWLQRMGTINDSSDSSAMGRVAVWRWTVDYVATHPWGGGFEMYRISQYDMSLDNGEILSIRGKAFHSIYFEMLGEGGVIALMLFLGVVFFARQSCVAVLDVESDDTSWLSYLGHNTVLSMYVYLVGGAFIGIAFQPFLYYLVALSSAIHNISSMTRRI